MLDGLMLKLCMKICCLGSFPSCHLFSESRDSDMAAGDMSDCADMMGQGKYGQMVVDNCNALGSGDHCQ